MVEVMKLTRDKVSENRTLGNVSKQKEEEQWKSEGGEPHIRFSVLCYSNGWLGPISVWTLNVFAFVMVPVIVPDVLFRQ